MVRCRQVMRPQNKKLIFKKCKCYIQLVRNEGNTSKISTYIIHLLVQKCHTNKLQLHGFHLHILGRCLISNCHLLLVYLVWEEHRYQGKRNYITEHPCSKKFTLAAKWKPSTWGSGWDVDTSLTWGFSETLLRKSLHRLVASL